MQSEYTALAALAGSVATVAGTVYVAFAKRSDSSVASRANLDLATRDILDRLRDDLKHERDCSELWERRARRADTVAHNLWHDLVGALQKLGDTRAPPSVPYLEDPF